MDKPTEQRIKFASPQFEIDQSFDNGQRVACQFEGEVTDTRYKFLGKDGESLVVYTITPLAVQVQPLKDGFYQPPKATLPREKSPSQRLRAKLYLLWQQQYMAKYKDFEVYYTATMDHLIDGVNQKLA